jgi:hypothetical protein
MTTRTLEKATKLHAQIRQISYAIRRASEISDEMVGKLNDIGIFFEDNRDYKKSDRFLKVERCEIEPFTALIVGRLKTKQSELERRLKAL